MQLSNKQTAIAAGISPIFMQDLSVEMQATIAGGSIVYISTGDDLWVDDVKETNNASKIQGDRWHDHAANSLDFLSSV